MNILSHTQKNTYSDGHDCRFSSFLFFTISAKNLNLRMQSSWEEKKNKSEIFKGHNHNITVNEQYNVFSKVLCL